MAATGEKRWPQLGRNRWPLTMNPGARRQRQACVRIRARRPFGAVFVFLSFYSVPSSVNFQQDASRTLHSHIIERRLAISVNTLQLLPVDLCS
jgi:hypothetical protein